MFFDFAPENNTKVIDTYGPQSADIHALTYDSRNVHDQTAFFCISGDHHDGHQFIDQAAKNGATVIIGTDQSILFQSHNNNPDVTYVLVEDAKRMMSLVSAEFYGHVYKRLQSIAVTGTNGKTTVTAFIHQLLNRCGIRTGSIGTEKVRDDESSRSLNHTTHTTPEAPDLHHIFNTFYKEGIEAVALEVTSIAIDQKRVDGLLFDIGVHTNLTPEHLDFHASFDQYRQSKLAMFRQVKKAVVNLDDTGMSQDILQIFEGEVLTYSLKQEADITAQLIDVDESGTQAEITLLDRRFQVKLPLFGEHNVSNLLAALAACLLYDVPAEELIEQISELSMPEGRLNLLETNTDYQVISDFAHTPDALVCVIEAARSMKPKNLILVVAGTGTRDPTLLPMLTEYAEGKADHLIVTTEHPDRRDRQDILAEMMSGFQRPDQEEIRTTLHREEAIKMALSTADEGDIVLLTGLGPLDHQIIHGKEVPYSEIDVIHQCLAELKAGTHSHASS